MAQKLKNRINLESWAVEYGCTDCSGCPALQWTICRSKDSFCQLGFAVEERDGKVCPKEECARPKTIGASYLIARALERPEPLVGKLSKDEYDRYLAKKEAAGC